MKWLQMSEIFANGRARDADACARQDLSERTFPTLGAAVSGEEPENEPTIQLRNQIADLEAVIALLTADIEEADPSIVDLDSLD